MTILAVEFFISERKILFHGTNLKNLYLTLTNKSFLSLHLSQRGISVIPMLFFPTSVSTSSTPDVWHWWHNPFTDTNSSYILYITELSFLYFLTKFQCRIHLHYLDCSYDTFRSWESLWIMAWTRTTDSRCMFYDAMCTWGNALFRQEISWLKISISFIGV